MYYLDLAELMSTARRLGYREIPQTVENKISFRYGFHTSITSVRVDIFWIDGIVEMFVNNAGNTRNAVRVVNNMDDVERILVDPLEVNSLVG